ncbi:DotG/IcmE/VirB10 family protein [Variovorax ginsengisoli]|uniref:DotG/IcmE/VirB10 family protein n=1 Tax=Variovorax ginsengisoli TaxID=363844 RepID=A0ABT8SDW4_9BURK|nr:DotG/IcmE/VirB10 family protein [Variovorax ginsengisoli]MDN8616471.1 DotG/IcmE/VirB10 family protein [Variovorax ginsengisoli]MDO1535641.1 DotG/IcmE/VirB10 family protein [Variovorax ginsengisoli]
MSNENQNNDGELEFADVETAESAAIAGPEAVNGKGKRLDPGAKRVMKWVGGAFAVALLAVVGLVFMASGKKEMKAKVDLPARTNSGTQTDVVQTDYEQGRLAELQEQKAEASRKAGGVYVPPPAGAPVTHAGPEGLGGPTGPGASSYQTYVTPPQVAIQPGSYQDPVRQQAIQEGLNRQLGLLLADAPTGAPIARVAAYQDPKATEKAQQVLAVQGQGVAAASIATEDLDLPGPLTIHAARTTSPIDTEKSPYVSAEVLGGKFAGAFLKGTAVLNQGEGLQVTFTDIRFNGKVAKINAVALDEQTSADALNGSIDRHILSRYVLPITFATVSGAASAIAQRSSQVVTNGLSTSVVLPEATDKQAAAAGLSSATQVGQQLVQSLAQQKNTVRLPANTLIGVLFNTVQTASSTTPAPQQQQVQAQPEQAQRQAQQAQPAVSSFNLATGMNYGTFAPTVPPINQVQVRY